MSPVRQRPRKAGVRLTTATAFRGSVAARQARNGALGLPLRLVFAVLAHGQHSVLVATIGELHEALGVEPGAVRPTLAEVERAIEAAVERGLLDSTSRPGRLVLARPDGA